MTAERDVLACSNCDEILTVGEPHECPVGGNVVLITLADGDDDDDPDIGGTAPGRRGE